jgi:hypothetical protein
MGHRLARELSIRGNCFSKNLGLAAIINSNSIKLIKGLRPRKPAQDGRLGQRDEVEEALHRVAALLQLSNLGVDEEGQQREDGLRKSEITLRKMSTREFTSTSLWKACSPKVSAVGAVSAPVEARP